MIPYLYLRFISSDIKLHTNITIYKKKLDNISQIVSKMTMVMIIEHVITIINC